MDLIAKTLLPQLRIIQVCGTSRNKYQRRFKRLWVDCSYERANGVVGVYNRRAAQWFSR